MTSNTPINDKELRKAWLKRKFGSFEYHEELVKLHEQWRNTLRKSLDRAEQDTRPNVENPNYGTIGNEAKNFRKTYMAIIETKPKPGDYKRDMWNQYHATGMFRSIPDYGRYLISEGDALSWMTEDEQAELSKFWGPMGQMASNIRRTVDDTWFNQRKGNDDVLLDEEYTGPIDWPTNWRVDVADLSAGIAPLHNIPAGQPCTHEGWWFTPAKTESRRYFKQGEIMPDMKSDYGMTIWLWDTSQ